MTRRTGSVSLVELVLVLALFSIVLTALGEFVVRQARLAGAQAGEVRLMEAVRTARIVLGADLRGLGPGDIASAGPDSLRIRAYRGGGVLCAADGARIGVRYRGHRLPDPSKDSVLVITGPGAEEARALLHVTGGACGGTGLTLELDAAPANAPALVLIHETGAYHLADHAVRYRRGHGGRQPMTEAVLARARFRSASGAVRFDMEPLPDSLPGVRRTPTVVVPLLNEGVLP